jgi:hypothetical protein
MEEGRWKQKQSQATGCKLQGEDRDGRWKMEDGRGEMEVKKGTSSKLQVTGGRS